MCVCMYAFMYVYMRLSLCGSSIANSGKRGAFPAEDIPQNVITFAKSDLPSTSSLNLTANTVPYPNPNPMMSLIPTVTPTVTLTQ